ncbi:transcriptional repressor [Paeniglutamicibacter antarcticus]|uniref:Transcriptional repressor n=1 Tax=Arthrobacter terrae TaxID=2935737 RepID=A0A931GBZ4_9MICC|nr:Fur family transcriptional regulator [Arthrobacter terrae]MBG0741237.1 transcriptional repressor [Arthrobacter terrae]
MSEARTSQTSAGKQLPRPSREQRITKQRVAVGSALDQLDDFVSTQELHRSLQSDGSSVALATVYRILQSMAEDGLVDVLRNAEGEAVYRRCSVAAHHHHLLCRTCGKAVEIEAPEVESWAAKTAAAHGFTEVQHTVEIVGLCPECSTKAAGN